MAPADLSSATLLTSWLVFGGLGFAFGFVLESAGFGDTRKLAGQFYLTEMTVLKVMFTAIVVAAVLIAGATSLGLLDMSRVYVNPTFLWPGIVGGLIMGVGFVVGGFCPGTSLVAAATLKLDGVFFVLGALVGVGLFGATVHEFGAWWLSSHLGRFTLGDWLGLSTGATLVAVVAMALGAFAFAGWVERARGHAAVGAAPQAPWMPLARRVAAAALLAAALLVALRGQPTADDKWARAPAETKRLVEERAVFVDPGEVAALRADTSLLVEIVDLRDERDFNLFHLGGARRLPAERLLEPAELRALLEPRPAVVTFLVGNGEEAATRAWRRLKAEGVVNVYVIEGGINGWLAAYPPPACVAAAPSGAAVQAVASDTLAWGFRYATGSRLPSSWPELHASRGFEVPCDERDEAGAMAETPRAASEPGPLDDEGAAVGAAAGASAGALRGPRAAAPTHVWPPRSFTQKVKLQVKTLVKGGCG